MANRNKHGDKPNWYPKPVKQSHYGKNGTVITNGHATKSPSKGYAMSNIYEAKKFDVTTNKAQRRRQEHARGYLDGQVNRYASIAGQPLAKYIPK